MSQFCRERGIPSWRLPLAAFVMLVARTARTSRVQMGVIERVPQALELDVDLSDRPSVRVTLERCQRSMDERRPFSSTGRDAIVLFAVDQSSLSPLRPRDASRDDAAYRRLLAEADLVASLHESGDQWRVEAQFDPALFDRERIAVVLESWLVITADAIVTPDQRYDDLDLLGDQLRARVLRYGSAPSSTYPPTTVDAAFEQMVDARPDAIAVVCGDVQLTYAAVDREADRIAGLLERAGVEPGGLCGVLLDRSAELIATMIGIAKARAVFVPLDPDDPFDRLRLSVETQGLWCCCTDASRFERATALGMMPIRVDESAAAPPRRTRQPWRPELDDPTYINLTSGSSGAPKAVLVPHRGIARTLFGQSYAAFGPDAIWMHASAVAFDATILETWGALLHGARCVIYQGVSGSPDELAETIQRFDVNMLWLTASVFNAMIELRPDALRNVRQLFTGGEALSHEHVRHALEALESTTLCNGYGPTESTVFTTCATLSADSVQPRRPVPIGRPIANTTVYLLDEWLQLVAPGTTGEIFIGGDGLAIGYSNSPELTGSRFLPDPFAARPGARMYKSGDLARWRPDGTLEYQGRVDNQVKIRGHRIEPGEIEAVLRQYPAVQEAVVTVATNEHGERQLIAHVAVNRPGITSDHLRRYIRTRLPEYMMPAAMSIVDRLPLTSTGKVDRQRLPSLPRCSPDVSRAPATELERAVAHVWQQLLATPAVDVSDDFFDVGGNSMLVFRLIDRLQRLFRIEVASRDLLHARTIAAQCAVIVESEPEPGHAERIARVLNTAHAMSNEEVREALARGELRGA